jgi:hypothetical protein
MIPLTTGVKLIGLGAFRNNKRYKFFYTSASFVFQLSNGRDNIGEDLNQSKLGRLHDI